jgi:hypothetical protein
MDASVSTSSALSPQTNHEFVDGWSAHESARPAGHILSDRWPTLARALSRYEQGTAEQFSQAAYECIDSGLIRLDDRRRLAREATAAGIRDFDAQLLIACAVRKWALDHRYDSSPSPTAPHLSFEYRAWGRVWRRLAIVGGLALALDLLIIWKWLS